jgi:catechol 2,3-dioxygenase-like lactoylglutathione lyase family enzyme
VPEGLRGRVSSLDFFVSLALMPVSMAIAGPAGAAFGITAVFVVAGIVPVFLALAAIVVPRLDRDELAHPLDHPPTSPPWWRACPGPRRTNREVVNGDESGVVRGVRRAWGARHLTNGDTVPRLVGLTTKGLGKTMKITDADHTNWRVKDVERSLGFYRDVLGLEPFGLEEYERGEHPLVSLRVTPEFILHLRPDPTFEAASTGGYDHLALVVEGTNLDELAEHFTEAGVEIERTSENVVGARGSGKALYVRDPDGYLIELKFYDVASGAPREEWDPADWPR